MNNALISPMEYVYSYDGTLLGLRIAETSENPFEVAPPLYWVECANDVNKNDWYFNTQINQCELKPIPPELDVAVVDTSIPPESSLNVNEIVS